MLHFAHLMERTENENIRIIILRRLRRHEKYTIRTITDTRDLYFTGPRVDKYKANMISEEWILDCKIGMNFSSCPEV